jgi:hypothetical protein
MIESRACPECGAEVPIGRLSCGACGALLASVDRHPAETPAGTRAPIASPVAPADVAAPTGPVATAEASARTAVAEPAAPAAVLAVPAPATPPSGSPDVPPSAVPTPDASPPATFAAPDEIELPLPPMPPIPGAYLAPSVVTRSAPITTTQPFPAAPQARLEPDAPSDGPPTRPEPALPVEPAPASPARAAVLDLPFAIAPGIGPRLVAAGAVLAIVAFVLPWVPNDGVVIGGAFGTGYFSSWGLAAVGNVLPFLVAWLSLVLAVLPNRVPRFAALGVLPLLLGGIYAGFGWTYLIGPVGAGIGIWALAVGAVLLAAGGTLVLRGEGSAG